MDPLWRFARRVPKITYTFRRLPVHPWLAAKVQTTLASGLIGAIVTAIIAIAGALLSAKNSKPDRDLKRLAVIEKTRELKQEGVNIPKDIELTYGGETEPKG